ncbi:MFS transporter [Corynebacterium resistens]
MCREQLTSTTTSATQRWAFLGVVSLGLLMISIDNSVLYTALPTLRRELHTTELEVLWIINTYPLVISGLLLGTGTLGDRIGHRRMFEVGLVIFALASIVATVAPNAEWLIAARAGLGVGAAVMMPATLSLIRITFTNVRERNTAIGVWGSVATIGSASGPVLGGFLLEHYWWGSVFLINIPVAILALLLTFWLAGPNQPNPNKPWDLITSIYAMIAMVGLVLAIKQATHRPLNAVLIVVAVLMVVVGTVLLNRRQKHLTEPLLAWDIFRNRVFTAGFLGAGGAMFVVAGLGLLTSERFQIAAGYSPLEAGLLTAIIAVAAFPASVIGGAMLHRVGFRTLISGGFVLMAVGVLLIVQLGWLIYPGFILIGLGAGTTMSVTSSALIGSAPAHRSGMAAALEEVSYEFGSLISVAILASVLPMFLRFTGDYDVAYARTLVIAAVFALAAAALSAILLKGNPKEGDFAQD